MSVNATAHTLNEFDIVLSISEAAINAQFLHLFLTPLPPPDGPDGKPVDPPPPIPGQQPPEREYLISHRLELKLGPKRGDGIFGYIECPRVEFTNLSDIADKKRTVKVVLKFIDNKPDFRGDSARGIPAYDPKYDSFARVFNLIDLDENGFPQLQTQSMNGCTVSFEAGLGRADIQEVMEKRYMYKDTYEAIEHGVKSSALLASSLFCLFQGDQIASSFTVVDADGNSLNQGIVGGLMGQFSNKYKHTVTAPGALPVATRGAGLPSPENPFVLGYGISQKVPQEVRGVPTFNPLNFQFSVTGSSLPGFATLNFLMLTRPIIDVANVKKNLNAGYFQHTFFERVNALHVDETHGRPVIDAVMAISRDLFVRQYIDPHVMALYVPRLPAPAGFQVSSDQEVRSFFENKDGRFVSTYTRNWWTDNPYRKGDHWTEILVGHYEKWSGALSLRVEYWGDDTRGIPVNGRRTIHIKISGNMSNQFAITNGVFPANAWDLDKCFLVNFNVPYEEELVVSSADEAGWTVTSANRSFPLTTEQNLLVLTFNPARDILYVEKKAKGFLKIMDLFGANEFLTINKALGHHVQNVSSKDYSALQESINRAVKGLSSTCVMPAGNVLFYNGLSTDDQGNIFSLVNYKTITGGKKF